MCVEFGESRRSADSMIRAYYGRMSKGLRKRLLALFEKSESNIRIVCATDAHGLGMNIPDTDSVIQWKAPPNVQSLLQ